MFYLTTHTTHFIYGYMASELDNENSSHKNGCDFKNHNDYY